MLLTGTHSRTLDDKKRLALPKRVREQLGDPATLFVTPGPDQCLWVYTQAELERQLEVAWSEIARMKSYSVLPSLAEVGLQHGERIVGVRNLDGAEMDVVEPLVLQTQELVTQGSVQLDRRSKRSHLGAGPSTPRR